MTLKVTLRSRESRLVKAERIAYRSPRGSGWEAIPARDLLGFRPAEHGQYAQLRTSGDVRADSYADGFGFAWVDPAGVLIVGTETIPVDALLDIEQSTAPITNGKAGTLA
jgi:hypothetical protein